MSESTDENKVTVDAKQLEATVTSIVSRIIAEAVTDVRKGQAPIVERLEVLNNTLMSMKNAQQATTQAVAELKAVNGKKSAVVYVGKMDPPSDLFGNANDNNGKNDI